jgi:hypothetical protein
MPAASIREKKAYRYCCQGAEYDDNVAMRWITRAQDVASLRQGFEE